MVAERHQFFRVAAFAGRGEGIPALSSSDARQHRIHTDRAKGHAAAIPGVRQSQSGSFVVAAVKRHLQIGALNINCLPVDLAIALHLKSKAQAVKPAP